MQVAKVLIKDPTIQRRTVGTNTFESQTGFLILSEEETLKIEVSLPRDTPAYSAGMYYLGGPSFDRDQYGRPVIGKRGLHLVPVPAAPAGK